jgi:hypothetical protein
MIHSLKSHILHCEDSAVKFSYRTTPQHPPLFLPHLYIPLNSGQCSKLKSQKIIRNQQETVTYIKGTLRYIKKMLIHISPKFSDVIL